MAEDFIGVIEKKGQGSYVWNGENCTDATCVYVGVEHNDAQFAIIRKKGAEWDKDERGIELNESASICWISGKQRFLLGLPTTKQDLEKLQAVVEKLIENKAIPDEL